jgi:hypothetical protein
VRLTVDVDALDTANKVSFSNSFSGETNFSDWNDLEWVIHVVLGTGR